ncbi:MAG: AAA family ATPase [Bacteroidales bacterium]|nr:AAA family ATPase [Bacteroidales bacterium]
MLKRIAILGPESTGKSYLAQALAAYYKSSYVAEYAREYIDKIKRPYEENDLLQIAKGQLKLEDQLAKETPKYLFCDTELTVIDIWSKEKYGRTHPWIIAQLEKRAYDLYLLCNIDMEWKEDHQRENPDDREALLNLYRESLSQRSINYHLISGQGTERTNHAIEIISKHEDKGNNKKV